VQSILTKSLASQTRGDLTRTLKVSTAHLEIQIPMNPDLKEEKCLMSHVMIAE